MIQNFKSKVKSFKYLSKDVFEFVLELIEPDCIDFKAGQYVTIKIPHEDEKPLFRAYSVASSPLNNKELLFWVKHIKIGEGSKRLAQLKIGDEVMLRGPMGEFILRENSDRDLLFVAGGTGIAPFHSMIDYIQRKGIKKNINVYFGLKNRNDFFCEDCIENLIRIYPNIKFNLCLSRENGNVDMDYRKGRVTKALDEDFKEFKNFDAYICGGKEFIEDVENLLISKGQEKENIFYEKYY
ncbi:MAG: hypothetical protein UR27_C0001G0057 [Candidatus Peregrinibacteria bacterium GW2011_GWA2_33_10]|nr:MAG: hypothetical protein UR27_C0001G0057 [Candidatus Peregrinibacteria bacterium GW2011_GWA2_33_10]